jgi:hypothetical protein
VDAGNESWVGIGRVLGGANFYIWFPRTYLELEQR